jgi:chemotaxis signal transduction protein
VSEKRYLIFRIEGNRHALVLEDVAEILDPSVFYPIPKAPGYYRGVMNCHGRPTPVLDLASLYYGKTTGEDGKVLVLDTKKANLALLVTSVVNIVFGPFPVETTVSSDGTVTKMLPVVEGNASIIEPDELLETLEAQMNGPLEDAERNPPSRTAALHEGNG